MHVHVHVPVLAGHEALRAIISVVAHQSCLPPLLISTVQDMQNVPVLEREALGRTVVIFTGIVVKQGSGGRKVNRV